MTRPRVAHAQAPSAGSVADLFEGREGWLEDDPAGWRLTVFGAHYPEPAGDDSAAAAAVALKRGVAQVDAALGPLLSTLCAFLRRGGLWHCPPLFLCAFLFVPADYQRPLVRGLA